MTVIDSIIMNVLKKCPFCGGNATLVKYNESVDGRYDELPYVKCACGVMVVMSYKELNDLKDKHGFIGGYISSNKSLLDEMHKMVSEKWNTRDSSYEEIVKDHNDY